MKISLTGRCWGLSAVQKRSAHYQRQGAALSRWQVGPRAWVPLVTVGFARLGTIPFLLFTIEREITGFR